METTPTAEFLECKSLHEIFTAAPDDDRRMEALERFCEARELLFALPPSRQKLNELLALSLIKARGTSDEKDFLSARGPLMAALETFEAPGEVA